MNGFSRIVLVCAICIGLGATVASAAGVELTLPAVNATAGEVFIIPILIDDAENLAGVKLSLSYDPDLLIFKKAEKTRATASLMHIVNDKKPGVLIIVMAGARGIKGKDFALLQLHFEAGKPNNTPRETEITIREIQLMSDQLKDIPARTVSRPIVIRSMADDAGEDKTTDSVPQSTPIPR